MEEVTGAHRSTPRVGAPRTHKAYMGWSSPPGTPGSVTGASWLDGGEQPLIWALSYLLQVASPFFPPTCHFPHSYLRGPAAV